MPEQQARQTNEQAETSGERVHINAAVLIGKPATIVPATDKHAEDTFEATPDKASHSTSRGKYAHVSYGSEDLIKDKRAEVELEDRPS